MTPCQTMAEFVQHNDKEVNKIISYLLKTRDRDVLCDYVQTFYLAAIRKNLLGSFDWSLPDTKKSFSSYIYTAIKNTVFSACRAEKRHRQGERISEVGCEGTGMDDVFEVMYIGPERLPKKNKTGIPSEIANLTVSSAYEASCFQEDEEVFFKKLEEFEMDIQRDTSLSESTKELYLTFIQLSAQGLQTSTIAEVNQVTPSYLTQVKSSLRDRFKRLKESVGYTPIGTTSR